MLSDWRFCCARTLVNILYLSLLTFGYIEYEHNGKRAGAEKAKKVDM